MVMLWRNISELLLLVDLCTCIMLNRQRRVAVIGGGAAGIAAGKCLLERGLAPTIFEAGSTIGGIWDPSSNRCWKSLRTNLSKFTCSFSDHPWPMGASTYPSQAEVAHYLNEYVRKFSISEIIRFSSHVTDVSYDASAGVYKVQVDHAGSSSHELFDKVVVASGFFTSTVLPEIPGLGKLYANVIHSQQYQSNQRFAGKNVLVLGSSFSSAEVVAEIAAVAEWVVNVAPRVSYMLPRYLPLHPDDPATPMVPIDMAFYRKDSNRIADASADLDADGPSRPVPGITSAVPSEPAYQLKHEALRRMFGPEHLNHGNNIYSLKPTLPPFTAISETFEAFLAAGKISVIHGHLEAIEECAEQNAGRPPLINIKIRTSCPPSSVPSSCHNSEPNLQSTGDPKTESGRLPKAPTASESRSVRCTLPIDDIICCTGFRPSLDFLDTELLQAMEYNAQDTFMPFLLHRAVLHPARPQDLAFVGMYRGPYFGIIEMQAVSHWIYMHVFACVYVCMCMCMSV